jgi:4'-phosphopantetheinyl transferase
MTEGRVLHRRNRVYSSLQADWRLLPGEVHMILFPLVPNAYHAALLSAEELDRCSQLRFPHLRDRYSAAHAVTRIILGRCSGEDPARVRIQVASKGKPFCADHALKFNLSHTAEIALLGVAWGIELGVDIEQMRELPDLELLAHHAFTKAEYEDLMSHPDTERMRAFFRCWTRKEAYMKAKGEGLSMGLDSFEVSLDDNSAQSVASAGEGSWMIRDLACPRGSFAAAGVAEGQADWRLWKISGSFKEMRF